MDISEDLPTEDRLNDDLYLYEQKIDGREMSIGNLLDVENYNYFDILSDFEEQEWICTVLEPMWVNVDTEKDSEIAIAKEEQIKSCYDETSEYILFHTPEFEKSSYKLQSPINEDLAVQVIPAHNNEDDIEYDCKVYNKSAKIPSSKKTKYNLIKKIRKEILLQTTATMDNKCTVMCRIKAVYEDKIFVYVVMEDLELDAELWALNHFRPTNDGFVAKYFRKFIEPIYPIHVMDNDYHGNIKLTDYVIRKAGELALEKHTYVEKMFNKIPKLKKREHYFYVAPELLKDRTGKSNDIYALGVIAFVLGCRVPPIFSKKSSRAKFEESMKKKIEHGFRARIDSGYGNHFPDSEPHSLEYYDLVTSMLEKDSQVRLSMQGLVLHPFFAEFGSNTDLKQWFVIPIYEYAVLDPFVQLMANEFCANGDWMRKERVQLTKKQLYRIKTLYEKEVENPRTDLADNELDYDYVLESFKAYYKTRHMSELREDLSSGLRYDRDREVFNIDYLIQCHFIKQAKREMYALKNEFDELAKGLPITSDFVKNFFLSKCSLTSEGKPHPKTVNGITQYVDEKLFGSGLKMTTDIVFHDFVDALKYTTILL